MKVTPLCKYIFLFVLLGRTVMYAQSPLIVNMQVLPPYSPVIADYLTFSASSVVTITNTSNKSYDVKLAIHIEGDNGIEAYTNPGFLPSLPITIAPFATRVINGSELQSYNDVGYTVTGTDPNHLLLTGIIPDGFYTICIQAQDYVSGAELSSPEPSGCIPIYIQYLDAPYLISPFCGDSIDQTYPQNIIFNWIAPPGAPIGTLYNFKMVEVIPFDRNPFDAMATATTPAFYETTTTIPIVIYGPSQPPLEVGHTYAWQVTASSPSTKLYFQNGGKSEVCSFIYKKTYVNYVNNDVVIPININLPVDTNYISINGNMQYYYASENSDGGEVNDENTETSATLYPFSSEPVTLVLKYMLKFNGGNDSIYLPWNTTGVDLPDNDAVIDFSTTTASGDFSLNILRNAFPDLGLVQQGVSVTIPESDMIAHYYTEYDGNDDIFIPDFGFGNETESGYDFGSTDDMDFDFQHYSYGSGFNMNEQIKNYNKTGTTYKTTGMYKADSGDKLTGETKAGDEKELMVLPKKLNETGGTVPYSNTEVSGSFTGDLYRVLQVYHNNEYFCMPNESFQPSDSGSVYVGTLKVRVRDYILNVSMEDVGGSGTSNYINTSGGTTIALDGAFTKDATFFDPEYIYMTDEDDDGVYMLPDDWDLSESTYSGAENPMYRYSIYRDTRPQDAPKTEGMNLNNSNDGDLFMTDNGYELVNKMGLINENSGGGVINMDGSVTPDFEYSTANQLNQPKDYGEGRILISRSESSTGSVQFNKMLKSIDPDDYYILVIEPVNQSFINPALEIKFLYDYDGVIKEDKALYGSQYITPEVDLSETDNSILSGTAVIEGEIKYKYDDPDVPQSFPLKNVTLTLQRLQYVIDENGIKSYSLIKDDLATTTTDAAGHYLFNYTDTEQYGLIDYNGSVTYGWGCTDIPDTSPEIDLIPDLDLDMEINMDIDNDIDMHINDQKEKINIEQRGPDGADMNSSRILNDAPGSGEGPCVASGKLYQELAIVVVSPYYTSPATHFTIEPAEHKVVSTLTCYVKAYDLEVSLISDPDVNVQYVAKNSDLRDMMIVLLRTNKPADVPENEVVVDRPISGSEIAAFINNSEKLSDYSYYDLTVNPLDPVGGGFMLAEPVYDFGYIGDQTVINAEDIVATAYASSFLIRGGEHAKITFKNLVKNAGYQDEYKIIAIPDYSNSDINYLVPLHSFKTAFTVASSTHPYGNIEIEGVESTNPEGVFPKMTVKYVIEAEPLSPVIFGKVLRSDNGYPLVDAKVQLLKTSSYPGGEATIVEVETTTSADGSYVIIPSTDQYSQVSGAKFSRALLFSKYGYDDTKTLANIMLKKGKILNRVADTIQPGVLVNGYIWLDKMDITTDNYPAIPSTIQIGNGPMVHTECVDEEFVLDASIINGFIEQTNPFDPGIYMEEIYEEVYDDIYTELFNHNSYNPNVYHFQNDMVFDGTDMDFDGGGIIFNGGDAMGAINGEKINVNGRTTNYSLGMDDIGDSGLDFESGGGINMNGSTCDLAYYATFASRGTWLAQIHPDLAMYDDRDQYVSIPDSNVYRLDFLLPDKMHRLSITIKDQDGNMLNGNVEVVGITSPTAVGADGKKDITFANAASEYHIIVTAPTNTTFVREDLYITNEPSVTFTAYTFTLDKGVNISGNVESDGDDVVGARVYVDAAGLEYLEAITGSSGAYTIVGVPKGSTYTIRAVKEASGLIGDSKSVSTSIAGYYMSNVDFDLDEYTSMDFSKLLGFDTEIESYSNVAGVLKISGALVNVDGNSNFSIPSTTELSFSNLAVKAGTTVNANGVPYAEPVSTTFTVTNSDPLQITVFGEYEGEIGITSGSITVEKTNTTSGKIKSPVKIMETSFDNPAFKIHAPEYDGFYLNNIGTVGDGTAKEKITLFATGTVADPSNSYYEIGMDVISSSLSFKVNGVDAYIKTSATNRIYKDSIVFDTWIDPVVYHTDGFEDPLHVGRIRITPETISSRSGTSPIEIEMEQWNLTSSDWTLNAEGFTMKTGNLDASGVEFKFTDIKVQNGDLVFETSNALGKSSVTLIDLLELEITNNPDFIYNGSHWQVYVGGTPGDPAATIENLPGLPTNSNDLTLQLLLFESDADAEFKMNNNSFTLYSVTSFTTDEGAMYVHSNNGEKYITLPGIIDLQLPSVSVQPTAFLIKNNNGFVSTELQDFGFGMEVNGIVADFNSGNIVFKSDGLIVDGTVGESPYFTHSVKLYHVLDSTAINTIANQKFQYTNNGQSLQNLFGRMYPLTSSWTNYQFTGDITGAAQTSGRWTFTVYGDILAENQKVDVSNLKMTGSSAMDFDNMGMSFDFPNRRLVGSLSIDESMPGGGGIEGQANCVFDDDGWYFVCGGQVTMPSNPYLDNVSLALLFGDYPIQNEQPVKEVFQQYSYNGSLPAAFSKVISGFYFDGKVEMPIPYVPNFEIDFYVVSGEFDAGINAGFQLGMNFTEELNTYYTGVMADIHVHAGVGASVVFGCAGVSLDAVVAMKLEGQYESNGDWFTRAELLANISANAYAGAGLACDSHCDGLCSVARWGGTMGVELEGELGHQNGDDISEIGIEDAYIK